MKKKYISTFCKIFTGLAFLLEIFSCSTTNLEQNSLSKVFVTNSKSINILEPNKIDSNVDSVYLLSANFGEVSFNILSYIQADVSGIFLDFLNDFGTSMGSLIYEEKKLSLNCTFLPKKLKGEYIVNDLQLVFYKSESLEQNYKNSGLLFLEKNEDEKKERFIYSGKKLIEKAEILENEIVIENFLRSYKYTLVSNGL